MTMYSLHKLHTLIALVLTIGALGMFVSPVLVRADAQSQSAMVDALQATEEEGGNNFGCMSAGAGMLTGCLAWASYQFMTFGAWIAGGASVILNYAVQDLVVGMGLLVGNITGITDAWVVLRDIANVFILFLTIFVGIATILNISSWNYKHLLWRIIIAALFVNFSLFFTKIVIDVSNLAATEIYGLILQQQSTLTSSCLQQLRVADFDGDCIAKGVAGAFWDQMKLTSFYNATKVPAANRVDASIRVMWVGLLGGLVFLVAAFVFASAAYLLIGRFITLVILMILSPIAFVAWVTKVSGSGVKWWRTLLAQSFFAPTLFLMWWVAFKIMESLNVRYNLTPDANFINSALMKMSDIALIFYFILIMGFLIASLMIAKSLGASGANAVMNTGKALVGGAAATAVAPVRYIRDGYNRLEGQIERTRTGRFARGAVTAATLGLASDRNINATLAAPTKQRFFGAASADERTRDFKNRRGEMAQEQRLTSIRQALQRVHANSGTAEELEADKQLIASMSRPELERMQSGALTQQLLKSQPVATTLGSRQVQGMEESAEYTEQQREKIRTARKDALSEAISAGDHRTAKAIVGNLTDNELRGVASDLGAAAKAGDTTTVERLMKAVAPSKVAEVLKDSAFGVAGSPERTKAINALVPQLSPAHLRALTQKDALDANVRADIRAAARVNPSSPAYAFFMKKVKAATPGDPDVEVPTTDDVYWR